MYSSHSTGPQQLRHQSYNPQVRRQHREDHSPARSPGTEGGLTSGTTASTVSSQELVFGTDSGAVDAESVSSLPARNNTISPARPRSGSATGPGGNRTLLKRSSSQALLASERSSDPSSTMGKESLSSSSVASSSGQPANGGSGSKSATAPLPSPGRVPLRKALTASPNDGTFSIIVPPVSSASHSALHSPTLAPPYSDFGPQSPHSPHSPHSSSYGPQSPHSTSSRSERDITPTNQRGMKTIIAALTNMLASKPHGKTKSNGSTVGGVSHGHHHGSHTLTGSASSTSGQSHLHSQHHTSDDNSSEESSHTSTSVFTVAQRANDMGPLAMRQLCLLSTNFGDLVNTPRGADFIVQCGPDRVPFYCHSLIFNTRWPMLMRENPKVMNDIAKGQEAIVHLTTVDPDIFALALEYIYTGTFNTQDLTDRKLGILTDFAKYRKVPGLKELANSHLLSRQATSRIVASIVSYVQSASATNGEMLRLDTDTKYEAYMATLAARATDLVELPLFDYHQLHKLRRIDMIHLIRRDDFAVHSEASIFKLVTTWAEKVSPNNDTLMENLSFLVAHVRLPLMTMEELQWIDALGWVPTNLMKEAYKFKETGVCNHPTRSKPRKLLWTPNSISEASEASSSRSSIMGISSIATKSSASSNVSSLQPSFKNGIMDVGSAEQFEFEDDSEETTPISPRVITPPVEAPGKSKKSKFSTSSSIGSIGSNGASYHVGSSAISSTAISSASKTADSATISFLTEPSSPPLVRRKKDKEKDKDAGDKDKKEKAGKRSADSPVHPMKRSNSATGAIITKRPRRKSKQEISPSMSPGSASPPTPLANPLTSS